MPDSADVLVVGEALVDLVVADGETTARPGGSPANVAVGLGRLGHEVRLLTALGDDAHGRLIRDHLEQSHVAVVAAPLARTSTALARLDASGKATYDFDISWDLGTHAQGATADWLHVGSLGAALLPGADQVLELARRVRAAGGSVTYDPNCRPGITGRDLERIQQLVALCRVVKLSDEDLAWLFPQEQPDQVAARWLAAGPELVVVTRGAQGAVAFTRDGASEVPPGEGGPVVDTVGAGDGFMAGLLAGLVHGLSTAEALARAAWVARRTCERAGADPPWS